MAALETELGCALFVRSKRGVTLTPQGERLYDHVHRACEEIGRGEQELLLHESGTVRLGISETARTAFGRANCAGSGRNTRRSNG